MCVCALCNEVKYGTFGEHSGIAFKKLLGTSENTCARADPRGNTVRCLPLNNVKIRI